MLCGGRWVLLTSGCQLSKQADEGEGGREEAVGGDKSQSGGHALTALPLLLHLHLPPPPPTHRLFGRQKKGAQHGIP